MATRLLLRVLQAGVIRYEVGGWPAPWGIEYRLDLLSAFVLCFVAGMGALVISFAPLSLEKEIPRRRQYLFCSLYLLCLTGLLGIVITGDLFNLFVFLEISSLSSYALISLGMTRRALVAAFQYLVMGTIGATFILIGIGLTYQMTGSLNMLDLAERLRAYTTQGGSSYGAGGLRLLDRRHQPENGAVSAAPLVAECLRLCALGGHDPAGGNGHQGFGLRAAAGDLHVFQPGFAFETLPLDTELMVLSLIGIFVASTSAIFQNNLKRMLAYSSIAQVGYMVLGISFGSATGLTAGIVHMFNHALIKGGLFMAVGCLALRLPSLELQELRGIGRRMPWTTFAWVLGGLGLIGVPLTAGFISKWYLILAAMQAGHGAVAALILISSLLSLVYVWRFVEVAYFAPTSPTAPPLAETPLAMLVPTYVVIGATLVFGVWTTFSAGVAHRAALQLLGADA